MNRSDLKLISVRIDEDSYNKISDIADRNLYWNKNFIIRKILYAVLHDFNEGEIFDMLSKPYSTDMLTKC